MTKLSVNVNKIATLRNSRGSNIPDLVRVSLDCQKFGAHGITVHPRPDQRHITYQDVYDLKEALSVELNVEGNPTIEFLDLVAEVRPAQCTLVPDKVNALTSSYGWNSKKYFFLLDPIVSYLRKLDIRTSIFVGTELEHISYAAKLGVDRVELYTGPYAQTFNQGPDVAIGEYISAARHAQKLGLEINAGHDLSLHNLEHFISNMPNIKEVSIGHALISESLYYGLQETIRRYLKLLNQTL